MSVPMAKQSTAVVVHRFAPVGLAVTTSEAPGVRSRKLISSKPEITSEQQSLSTTRKRSRKLSESDLDSTRKELQRGSAFALLAPGARAAEHDHISDRCVLSGAPSDNLTSVLASHEASSASRVSGPVAVAPATTTPVRSSSLHWHACLLDSLSLPDS